MTKARQSACSHPDPHRLARDGQGMQAALVSLNLMVFAETENQACSFTRLRGVRVSLEYLQP